MSAWQNSWATEDDQQIIAIVFSLDVQKRIAKIYVSINVYFVAAILTSSLPWKPGVSTLIFQVFHIQDIH